MFGAFPKARSDILGFTCTSIKLLQNDSSKTFCQLTFYLEVLFVNFNFIEKNNPKSDPEYTRKLPNKYQPLKALVITFDPSW